MQRSGLSRSMILYKGNGCINNPLNVFWSATSKQTHVNDSVYTYVHTCSLCVYIGFVEFNQLASVRVWSRSGNGQSGVTPVTGAQGAGVGQVTAWQWPGGLCHPGVTSGRHVDRETEEITGINSSLTLQQSQPVFLYRRIRRGLRTWSCFSGRRWICRVSSWRTGVRE